MTESDLYESAAQWFSGFSMDTDALTQALKAGEMSEAFRLLAAAVLHTLGSPFVFLKSVLLSFLLLGIGAAVLKILDETLKEGQAGLIGGYIVRLLLAGQLMILFEEALDMSRELINTMVSFGSFFVPVFSVVLTTVSGTGTAAGYISLLSLVIYIAERLLLQILLPLLEVHFLLVILAGFWQKERLERILKLMEKGFGFICKALLGGVTGLGFLQSLVLPYADALKMGTVQKAAQMIPGVGSIAGSTWDLLTGSAVLLKNTIGVLGVAALALAAAYPLCRLFVFQLSLRLSAALMSLLGAGELGWSVEESGTSVEYLMKVSGLAMLLFLVWVILAVCTTNLRLMY
ncbi:MAG: stage III sporulation protein AE [Lachnospiraceae bacterium]|nr:stage III sporulation protein AE [Lachnospiraceae bacterium]